MEEFEIFLSNYMSDFTRISAQKKLKFLGKSEKKNKNDLGQQINKKIGSNKYFFWKLTLFTMNIKQEFRRNKESWTDSTKLGENRKWLIFY